MRFSWENDILMRFSHELFTGENLIFLTSVESSWESHEILMRKPSHENFVSAFSHDCIVYSLDQEIHAKVNIRCMHVVLVKENHFEVLSSSKLNMFTWVEMRLCVLVHVRVLVTWQRTNSVTIDRVTAFDHEAIVRIRTIVIRWFCGLRLRSFQVRF